MLTHTTSDFKCQVFEILDAALQGLSVINQPVKHRLAPCKIWKGTCLPSNKLIIIGLIIKNEVIQTLKISVLEYKISSIGSVPIRPLLD